MTHPELVVKPAWYAGFLVTTDAASVTYLADTLFLHDQDLRLVITIQASNLQSIVLYPRTFSNELGITENNGTIWTCRGPQCDPSAQITRTVNERIIHHCTERAKSVANKLAPSILATGTLPQKMAIKRRRLPPPFRKRSACQSDPRPDHPDQCNNYVSDSLQREPAVALQQLSQLAEP